MKKLLFLTTMMFAVLAATAQGRYYTLTECGNDPLKYIERNYEDNGTRYKGKTVAEFIEECELELRDFVPYDIQKGEGGYDPDNGKLHGVAFDICKDNYLYIFTLWFNRPYTYSIDDYYRIADKDFDEFWQDKFYQFFKDYTIDDISILKRKDGKPIKNYRRP